MMRFREAVTVCFQDYWTFTGRASRAEYWWFILFVVAGSVVLQGVDAVLFGADMLLGLNGLFAILTFLPQLAVAWRRLHDTGLPGWVNLVPGIPLAAILSSGDGLDEGMAAFLFLCTVLLTIGVIVMLARPGDPRANRYGPPPPR